MIQTPITLRIKKESKRHLKYGKIKPNQYVLSINEFEDFVYLQVQLDLSKDQMYVPIEFGDKEIINHDGNHGFSVKDKAIVMEKGLHKLKIEYFQATSSMALDVEVEYPGFEKTTIPRSWLFRPATK